ncbi:MAG: hypothetical protein LUQ69_09705 [Methanoregulaceae archaeon]|nr:hypothetical protein [Methanoregulaceae archaeon]
MGRVGAAPPKLDQEAEVGVVVAHFDALDVPPLVAEPWGRIWDATGTTLQPMSRCRLTTEMASQARTPAPAGR